LATITSLGIGSGLDINSIVSQLVALERRPLQQMQTDTNRLQTKVSAFGQMKSLFSSLQDASNKLNTASLWTQASAASSDETAVATVGGASAAPGNYAISVSQLAANQTVASRAVLPAATDLVGEGTLSLQLGSWDEPPSVFSAQSGSSSLDIAISDTDTLQSLRDKINSSGAGVTASLITDASGVRLALRSTDTGLENGFRASVTDGDGTHNDGAGLSRFAFDPENGAAEMDYKQAALNAVASINGIEVNSASNELNGVIEGLTLRLRKTTTTPGQIPPGAVDVAVTSDRESIRKAVEDFAAAYNSLSSYISNQTKYDAASNVGGLLQGDSAVSSLMSRLRGVINAPSGASSSFPRLTDIGLELQRDGTLKADTGKLDSALTNLPELKKAFSNRDTLNPSNDGFARRYADLATQVLAVDGTLTTRTEGLQKLITKNKDSAERLEDRVTRFEARLVQQYTAMDANLSRLNALQSYVTQQLAALSNQNNNN
jgi:flagellar hook-associated protein 2